MTRWFSRSSGPSPSRATAGRTMAVSVLGVSLVLIANLAGGATVVRLSAPYHGVALTANSNAYAGCRAHDTVVMPAGFSMKTGSGGFADQSSAGMCATATGPAAGSTYAYVTGSVTVDVHIPIIKVGWQTVTAHWVVTYSGATKLRHGSCPASPNPNGSSCTVQAEAYVEVAGWLVDATNGSYYAPATSWPGVVSDPGWTKSCYSSGCGVSTFGGSAGPFAGSVTVTMAFSASLKSGHHYFLETSLSGGTSGYATEYGVVDRGGYAAGILNFGLLGSGARLTSIVVG